MGMRKMGLILLCGLALSASTFGAEGKGIHGLFEFGVTHAMEKAYSHYSVGEFVSGGLLFPLTRGLDLAAKIEYQTTPAGSKMEYYSGGYGSSPHGIGTPGRYSAIMIGTDLMASPHKRGFHFVPVILAGGGAAGSGNRGESIRFRTYVNAGFGIKAASQKAPSALLLVRLTAFQLNGSANSFVSLACALKF
jgi:hypothetical protein